MVVDGISGLNDVKKDCRCIRRVTAYHSQYTHLEISGISELLNETTDSYSVGRLGGWRGGDAVECLNASGGHGVGARSWNSIRGYVESGRGGISSQRGGDHWKASVGVGEAV